jgi:predicted esterase
MTGVSGGGFTTISCAVIDPRVRILGPSCFGSPDADHPIANGYAGCPETLFFNRYALSLGMSDLLSATRFRPILLMGGRRDRVLTPAKIGELATAARAACEGIGAGERVRLFIDECGHEYSARQADEFLRWIEKWWSLGGRRGASPRGRGDLLAPSLLQCAPPHGLTMGRFVRREVRKLPAPDERRMRTRLRRLVGLGREGPRDLAVRCGRPVGIWSHELTEAVFGDGAAWEMPATILTRLGSTDGDLMLFFDDRGRWSSMHQWGWLMRAVGMFQTASDIRGLVTVDLPGWGDTRPAPSPWDVVGWGGTDRWMAYVSAASGDSVMAMRVREAVRCARAACATLGVAPKRLLLGGRGLGANVAAGAALLIGPLRGLVLVEPLASYASLAEASHAHWPHDAYFPGILSVGDFGDMLKLCRAPVLVANPLDAACRPARRWRNPAGHVTVLRGANRADVESGLAEWVRMGRNS